MKINLLIVSDSFLCFTGKAFVLVFFPAAFEPRLFECGEGGCYLSAGTDPVP